MSTCLGMWRLIVKEKKEKKKKKTASFDSLKFRVADWWRAV